MSIEAITHAWKNSKHSGGVLLVLLALADHAGDNGVCWPSLKTLAGKSRLSERQVRRCLRQLEQAGEITLVSLGKGRESSVYKVNSDEGGQIVRGDTRAPSGGTPMSAKPSLNRHTATAAVPRTREQLTWSPEKSWQGMTEELKAELAAAYPACNVDRQLLSMEQWLKANPERARKSNWRRFVTHWLSKEQDRGGDKRGGRYETKSNVGAGSDRRGAQTNHGANGGEGESGGLPII